MSEEEKEAIETLKEVASDDFDTLGDDISPKMAQNILNVIDKQQKEIEEKSTIIMVGAEKVKQLEKEIEELKVINQIQEYRIEVIDERELISKDKIRDYFAHDIAFKRRLIRENEEISDYNRGKFDTIEDLFERLENNKWN